LSPITLACVVEGHGEQAALPVLLRRIAAEHGSTDLVVPRPHRIPKSRLMKPGELEAAVEAAGNQLVSKGGILVLVDADDECPATVAPELVRRATAARPDKPVGVVMAKFEFEAWFIAGITALAGQRQLESDLAPPPDPEGIHDAKGWLSRQMTEPRRYKETTDQAAFAARFDLAAARKGSPSFDKMWREVVRLLDH
jgi:hypothetical protein